MPLGCALMLLGGGVVSVIALVKSHDMRDVASGLCEKLSDDPAIAADVSRDAFAQLTVDPVSVVQGHTHANAAALRTSATRFAQNTARYCGAGLYVIGMSKSDQRKGMRGSRRWYWTKDVNTENRNDPQRADDIRYLCDVDYYVDMPDLLASDAKPTLLYTVVPEAACSTGEDDTTFTFEEDGALSTYVAGGGRYSHMLWDYASDSFLVVRRFLGIPYRSVAYAVERKQVSKHRQVILLAPIREFGFWASIFSVRLLATRELVRFNPIVEKGGEKFVRFNVMDPKGCMLVTTARPGGHLAATVPCSEDESVATVARLATTNLMLPTTASWVKDRAAAAVLTEYHRLVGKKAVFTVYPVDRAVRAYQFKPLEYDQDAKPKLQAFMSPMVHGAFAPIPNKAGEEQCVQGRINSLKKPEPRPSAFRDQCIEEFADLIVQRAILEPVCYEVVENKQTSAAQKVSLRKAVLTGQFRQMVLKCFIKAEAYPDPKDPRNISTYNDADKLDMATFALALSDHMKQFPWYGPGKTPLEIATRVAEICRDASFVNISDYHRMDGTITYALRQVERVVCMKAFVNHRTKLNELLKTNVDNKGYLPHGTTFDQGSSHGSGCSATSLFQTLRAAFNAYLAYRHTRKPSGTTYSPEEAFASLGIHLGDDGLDADLPVESHQWASKCTGLILEAAVVQRGDRGVNFLARYYSPFVWDGCLDSMCDVKRQLSKFHTTVRLPSNITPEQKLVEKAMSYVATDGATPVLGEFCKRVLLLSSYRPKRVLGVGSWWAKFDGSVQFPNSNVDGWMDVEFEHLLPGFDRSAFNQWLAQSDSAQELLHAPLFVEPKPAALASVAVVVDEEIIPPRSTDGTSGSPSRAKSARGTRRVPRRQHTTADRSPVGPRTA